MEGNIKHTTPISVENRSAFNTKPKLQLLMRSFVSVVILILGSITFLGCSKEAGVIEYKFGVTKIDRSIPTDYDIVEFSVVTEEICFAIGQNNGWRNQLDCLEQPFNFFPMGFKHSVDCVF